MAAQEHALTYRAPRIEPESRAGRGAERSARQSPSATASAFALSAHASAKDLGADAAGSLTSAPVVTSTPATSGGKSVDVYPISLPGSSRDAAADIARANAIWAQCSLSVNMVGGQTWQTNVMDLLDPKGVLNEYANPNSPTVEETTMLAYHPSGSAIPAYYVPSMSAGSRGESFGPSWTPSYTAVVISDSAASDSLAHELGHVLMDDKSHHPDPDNLMASGSIRNVGVDNITPAQCAKI